MGFINDEIQVVGLLLRRVFQGFPYRPGAPVARLGQLALLAQLLRVEEVDVTLLQRLHVEGFLFDGHALAETNLIGLHVDLILRLRVQLRGIGQPHEDGLGLLHDLIGSKQDVLDQRGHDDGLAGASRRGKGDDLRRMRHPISIQRGGDLHPKLTDSLSLEWK